jgi:virginiamycin B lyase
MHKKNLLFSFLLLTALLVGATFFGTVRSAFALSAQVIAQDWYTQSGIDPWGTTFDSNGNVWVAVPGCDPGPNCPTGTPPGKIEEFNPTTSSWIATYQLPAGYGQALFLAFDKNGNIWFPMFQTNTLGKFTPSTHTFKQWKVPTANSGPWDLAIDNKGFIWITEHYSNKIARFNPGTHTFKEFTTPAANSIPYGIVVDASNNVWFTENNGSLPQIGEYKSSTGHVLEYKIRSNPPNSLTPHLITIDPNGNLWWTEGFVGMIGELQVKLAQPGTNNGVKEYPYPLHCQTCGIHTSGISVDSKGLVWFDDSNQSIFASFPDSGTGSFSEYNTPTPNSHPHDGLRVDSQNRIWFDEEFANKLARATQ